MIELNPGQPQSPDTTPEALAFLNEQAVKAFLNHTPGIEAMCEQILNQAAPDGWENPRDLPATVGALRTLGRYYMVRTEFGKALDALQRSLRLCEEGHLVQELPAARAYVGVVFTRLGDYSRAAELLREAHRDAEAIHDTLQVAEVLNDLSYTYVMAGEPQLALTYLEKSIQIFRELGDDMRLSWTLESLGQANIQIGRNDEALACMRESLNLAYQHGMWIDVVRFTLSMGEMFRALGDLPSALGKFEEALELARRYGIPENECAALFRIAEHHQSEGRFTETLPLLLQAEQIAHAAGLKPHLRQCCLLLSRAYKHTGDYYSALRYHEHFYEIEKELFNADTDQRLRNVQALYQLETAKKETELYQLRAQALQLEVEERKRTEIILEHMAGTDPLTELLNRRAFFVLAERAFSNARQAGAPLSIILIDIDHFKAVNDQHGHLVGDQALVQVAERLRTRLRTRDRIARYGGEEFIILLEDVTAASALAMAERLRQAVAGECLQARGLEVPVTISLGVAVMDPSAPLNTLDQLIAQADDALFAAKHNGRNAAYAYQLKP